MPEVQLELHAMLRKLHLSGMADNFGDLALKAASAHLTYETYLAEVVHCECVLREQRRIARLLRQSGLPADKTFRTLQLDRFPLVVQQQVEHLRGGTFIADAVNIVAVGKPGVGKSHLLAALGHELILQGKAVLWTSTATLVQQLLAAKRDLHLPHALAKLNRYTLLAAGLFAHASARFGDHGLAGLGGDADNGDRSFTSRRLAASVLNWPRARDGSAEVF